MIMKHDSCPCLLFTNVGGLFFVDPMRDRKCMTVLDPFNAKYGKAITTALSVVSLFLDVIWVPTTLTGLGTVDLPTIITSFSTSLVLSHLQTQRMSVISLL